MALKAVSDAHDLMIVTVNGTILRIPVSALRVMGRATQGVRLINLRETDSIASVASVAIEQVSEVVEGQENTDIETGIQTTDEKNGREFDD